MACVSSGVSEQVLFVQTVDFNLIGSLAMPMTELDFVEGVASPIVLRISLHLLQVPSELLGSLHTGFAGSMAIGVAGEADPSSFPPMSSPAFAAAFVGFLIFNPVASMRLATWCSVFLRRGL